MAILQKINPPSNVPGDYLVRPATLEDAEAAAELFNIYSRWQTGANQTTAEETRSEWQEPGYNLEESTMTVWNAEGHMVGYIEFYDRGEPHVSLYSWAVVHPDHQGKGLGSLLIDWAIERARTAVSLAPEGARVALQQSFLSPNTQAEGLLTQRGFTHVRNYYRMVIDFDQPPAAPEIPEGITIRSISRGEERMAIHAAFESFHDHWGFVDEPFEQYFRRWYHHLQNDPKYDPSLWFVAMDGNEVAGISLCYSQINEDPDMAWVGTLGVRRPWRKKGLGTALLLHSFGEFYRRGKPRAGLGVDATNITGALRIYEKSGMHQMRKYSAYELELRPGKDLRTQTA